MATIETDIDIDALKKSGKRGRALVNYAYNVLLYDGEKLLHTAIHAGATAVDTQQAASIIGYEPVTLYKWSSTGDGPLIPMRIGGKPLWKVRDLRNLLGIAV